MAHSEVIRAEGLRKSFRTGEQEVHALRGVDLHVDPGSVLGLLGANGSGKTTLVRVLTTLARPTAGRAWVCGRDVVTEPAAVRSLIGVTGQRTSLDNRLSGAENLHVIGRLSGLSRSAARRRADELLGEYDLGHAADRPVGTYSGGMRRRLDIVSGLVRRPRVLFLDEPTTGLDARSRSDVWEAVSRLAASGTSVLLTTQYLDEADRLADRVAVLAAGRVVADATPRDLKARLGRRLTVTLDDAAQGPRARTELARLGVTGLARGSEAERGARTVSGRIGPDAEPMPLPRLLDTLAEAGIEVADIGLSTPTLDDAYLTLTKELV